VKAVKRKSLKIQKTKKKYTMTKRKEQTKIDKTVHRKLKIEQHEQKVGLVLNTRCHAKQCKKKPFHKVKKKINLNKQFT
jgi:hypothetical protein